MTIVLPAHGDLNWDATLNTALTTLDTNSTAALNALIPKTTVTAKGDILVATGNATVVRLGAGTDGQVLTADSTQTAGVKWAASGSAPVTSVAGKTGAVTLVESDIGGLVADLAAKAADASVVHLTGAETVNGVKTFTSSPVVPDGSFPEAKVIGLTTDLASKANDNAVVHLTGAESIGGVKTFTSAPVVPAGAFPESAVANLTTDLAAKAADSAVVHNTGAETIAGVKTFSSAPVVPVNSFPESAVTNLTTDLAAKANDSAVVHNTGAETIAGVKTFSSAPVVPSNSFPETAVTNLVSDLAAKATDTAVVHLAGTETITGAKTFSVAPTVPSNSFPESAVTNLVSDLAGKVPTNRSVTAGTGLTGGGDLSADRSFAVTYGTTAGTAAQGNDSRITGAIQSTAVPYTGAVYAPARSLPQWQQPSTILTEFQSGHGFTNNAGSTFTANDTTDFVLGTQAAKLVTGGAGASANVSKTGMSAFDTTSKVIRIRLKVDDITHMTGLNFFLGTSSFANNYKWIIQGGAAGSNYIVSGQWLEVTLNWHDATTTGSPTRTGLTDVRLQVVDDATATVTAHFQSIELIPDGTEIFPKGVVSICFDDTWQSMADLAKPRLDLYGYPASVYTIQDMIGQSGRLTMAELTNLQDLQGWELGSHAFTDSDHALTYTGMTAAQLDSDLLNMKGWGLVNGYRGADGTAYPLGQYGSTTDSVSTTSIIRKYFNYARTTNSKTKETFPPADPFRLRAISSISSFSGAYSPTTITGAGGDLDKTVSNGTWLILVFHKVTTGTVTDASTITQTDFNSIIDAINSKGIPVVPVGDVLKYYYGSGSGVSPVSPTSIGAVPTTRSVIAGTGLTGGGTLSADRTLAVSYGTTAGTAAQGNDSRITGAVQTTRTLTAGTGLSGGGDLSADRTFTVVYGTTSGTAAQGNDSRITGAVQSSTSARITAATTAPASPAVGDIWIDTN